MAVFHWPTRVYWEDTDGGGVVYHSRYVNFLERARTEWLRAKGYDQRVLQRDHDLVFAIRHIEIDFILPAHMDDRLLVSVEVIKSGGASVHFAQTIVRENCGDESEQIVTAVVYAASLTASTFRPVRMPADMRRHLTITTIQQ